MRPSEILKHLLSYQYHDTKVQESYDKEPVSAEVVNSSKNHLIELERLFKGYDKVWLEHYNYLKERSKLPAVVEISRNYIRRSESFVCGGCGIELPKVKIGKAEELEEIVTCETCGRIIYSEIEPSIRRITENEIKNEFLRSPPHLDLHYNSGEKFNILDFWYQPWPVLVENNCLVELGPLFDKYSLEPEDYIFIYKLPDEEDKFRLIPEIISESDKTKILTLLENAERHIDLSEIIDSVLSKKVEIFGYLLIKGELLKLLQEDSQFGEFLNKVIEKRKIPSKIIEIPSQEQEKVVVLQPQLTKIEIKFKLTKEALKRGYLIVGKNLRDVFESYGKHGYITIVTHVDKESKAIFSRDKWSISGLTWFYKENQLEIGDSVYLKIEDVNKRKFRLCTDWKRNLEELRELIKNSDPSKLKWAEMSCRDIVYFILQSEGKDLHYRDIYVRLQEINPTKLSTLMGILSRYNGRIFTNVGKGKWGLLEWYSSLRPKKVIIRKKNNKSEEIKTLNTEEDLWRAVVEIEANDLVYETLKRQKRDLYYEDICKILGSMLNIDCEKLAELSFLNPQDKRLFRNEDGSWTLREFVEKPKEIEMSKPGEKEFFKCDPIKRKIFIVLMILAVLIGFVVLKFLH